MLHGLRIGCCCCFLVMHIVHHHHHHHHHHHQGLFSLTLPKNETSECQTKPVPVVVSLRLCLHDKIGQRLPAEMPTNLIVVSNNTEDELLEPPGHNFLALIFGLLLILVVICGNLLVCLSVYTEKALKTTTNYFIVSLAVSDLMLSVLVLPLFVYTEFQDGTWSLNMTVCDGLMTMDVMLCTASIFNLCAISVDRFIAVSIPLNYNRKHVDQRQIGLLSATWVIALAVASPIMFGINNVPDRDPGECKLENDDYVLYSSVCSFFIPCPIMVLLYCGMFRGLRNWEEARKAKLRKSIQACRKLQECGTSLPPLVAAASVPPPLPPSAVITERELGSSGDIAIDEHPPRTVRTLSYNDIKFTPAHKKKRPKINGRERKAMKVLPIVVGVFLFCWTPFFVVHTLKARCKSCYIPPSLMSVVTWLGYVNSAVNPIIYTVFNTEFRNFFKKFLHNCWSRLNSRLGRA